MLTTAFFGSSSYTLPILETLKKHTDFRLIITRSDKPEGRKKIITSPPPKIWGQKQSIEVITPESLTREREMVLSALERHHINVAIVADYGLLIPKDIFEKPRWKTLNIHFSKLPDLRGPSPVQWTILRGDTNAWISIFPIEEDLDTGPILSQKEYPLKGTETTGELYTSLFEFASTFLPEVLLDYTTGKITPREQDHTKATFCRHLTREDGCIDWETLQKAMRGEEEYDLEKRFFPEDQRHSDLPDGREESRRDPSAQHKSFRMTSMSKISNSIFIERMTRAFSPWPGVWTKVGIKNQESRIKILKAHLDGNKLVLDQVQLEGKKPESWKNLTNLNALYYS